MPGLRGKDEIDCIKDTNSQMDHNELKKKNERKAHFSKLSTKRRLEAENMVLKKKLRSKDRELVEHKKEMVDKDRKIEELMRMLEEKK